MSIAGNRSRPGRLPDPKLLNIILGGAADSFISTVARNATAFLQRLPPGVLLGVALIVMIYGLVKSRLQS